MEIAQASGFETILSIQIIECKLLVIPTGTMEVFGWVISELFHVCVCVCGVGE